MDRFPGKGPDGSLKLPRCVVVSFTTNTCMTSYLRGTVSMHCNVLRFQSRSVRSLIYELINQLNVVILICKFYEFIYKELNMDFNKHFIKAKI